MRSRAKWPPSDRSSCDSARRRRRGIKRTPPRGTDLSKTGESKFEREWWEGGREGWLFIFLQRLHNVTLHLRARIAMALAIQLQCRVSRAATSKHTSHQSWTCGGIGGRYEVGRWDRAQNCILKGIYRARQTGAQLLRFTGRKLIIALRLHHQMKEGRQAAVPKKYESESDSPLPFIPQIEIACAAAAMEVY